MIRSLTGNGTAYAPRQGLNSAMKNIYFFFIALLVAASASSQDTGGISSVTEAAEISKMILKAAGKKSNFLITEAKVPNAMAVLTNGQRFILYNPGFIQRLTKNTGTPWAGISVLAHEIGHHLNTRTENGKTVPMATELEADEFSGYVLRKLGASLEEAQAAMKTLASDRATRTHPARADRLSSIAEGWEDANNETGVVALKQRTTSNEHTRSTGDIVNNSIFLAEIHFDADPGTTYHLTNRYHVVKIKDNVWHRIGKLARLDNTEFPYLIFDEAMNRVYITASGNIVNARGNNIGKMLRLSTL